jgi:hypothetical protein
MYNIYIRITLLKGSGGKVKKKKNYFYLIFFILFISLLFQEMAFRYFAFGSIFGIEIIRIILFVIATSLIFTIFFSIFNKKTTKILICSTIFLLGFYAILQLGFKNFMDNFVSLNTAGEELGRITDLIIEFLRYIKLEYFIILIPFLIVLILCIIEKDRIERIKLTWYRGILLLASMLAINLLALFTLGLKMFNNSNLGESYKTLYKEPIFVEVALKQFGTTRFLFRDFLLLINPSKDTAIDIEAPTNNNNKPDSNSNKRVINDTEWNNIIANEKDPDIVRLHNYFKSKSITPKNEYTGLFKGKNFILFMVEAFDMIAIDKDLTPTLYKMANEGWNFTNHYSPVYSCATGASEHIAITSIVPNPTVCAPNEYDRNNYMVVG